jgi:transposase-like protein
MAENKSNYVRASITDAEKERVVKMAEERGMSVSSFVRWVLIEYLNKNSNS